MIPFAEGKPNSPHALHSDNKLKVILANPFDVEKSVIVFQFVELLDTPRVLNTGRKRWGLKRTRQRWWRQWLRIKWRQRWQFC
jgi:hypothetical protein